MPTQLPLGVAFESNPLAVEVPRDIAAFSETLYNYLDEQGQSLRSQLNLQQAGDTTNAWQNLTGLSNKAQWNLGAEGSFVHPVYGMIRATYVRFDSPKQNTWSGAPVGWAMSPGGFTHGASTDLALSEAALVIGQQAGFAVPTDGNFGWVVTKGVNIQSLLVENVTKPTLGDRLNWAVAGHAQVGTVNAFATVMGSINVSEVSANLWDCGPGSVFIDAP